MQTKLIEHNPLLKHSIVKVLILSEQNPRALRGEIEALATASSIEGFSLQSPVTIVDILVRNGALKEDLYVNGELYAGSLQEVQTDASIEDDAVVEQYLSITELGKELLEEYAGDKKLRALLAEKPQYKAIYLEMLAVCDAPQGKSRADVELAIQPMLAGGFAAANGAQEVYPQYFIDSLETAGGISWQDSWHTTDAGRAVVLTQR